MSELNKPEPPAPYIDHTVLNAAATPDQVRTLCITEEEKIKACLLSEKSGSDRIGAGARLSIIGRS